MSRETAEPSEIEMLAGKISTSVMSSCEGQIIWDYWGTLDSIIQMMADLRQGKVKAWGHSKLKITGI